MQGKSLPLSRYTTLPPAFPRGFLNLYRNIECGINCFMPQGFERRSDVFVCAHMGFLGAQGKNRETRLILDKKLAQIPSGRINNASPGITLGSFRA